MANSTPAQVIVAQNLQASNIIKARENGTDINLIIDTRLPEFLVGDPLRLGQVINNLLSNAAKFTKNGLITFGIKVNAVEDETVHLHFSIEDTGVGIAKQDLGRIFESFTQTSSSVSRKYGGTGLGLTICKQLLKIMGTEITVTSELGRGSSFDFDLQLKIASRVSLETSSANDEELLNGMNILLVEDMAFNVLFARHLLEGWRAKVDVAENGEVAVSKLKNQQYDVVLMDLEMPVMDGYASAKGIRVFDNKTPIIALTASATVDIKDRALSCGMQDYISKPFNPKELYAKLKKHTLKK